MRCLFGRFVGAVIASLVGPGNDYTDVFDGYMCLYPSGMMVFLALPSLRIADIIDYPSQLSPKVGVRPIGVDAPSPPPLFSPFDNCLTIDDASVAALGRSKPYP